MIEFVKEKISSTELLIKLKSDSIFLAKNIDDDIYIDKSKTVRSLEFRDCKFQKLIIDTPIRFLRLKNCFFQEVVLGDEIYSFELSITKNSESKVWIQDISISIFNLSGVEINELYIDYLSKIKQLRIKNGIINKIWIHGEHKNIDFSTRNLINEIKIDASIKIFNINKGCDETSTIIKNLKYLNSAKNGVFFIEKAQINEFLIQGNNVTNEFDFSELETKDLSFYWSFGLDGIVKLRNCDKIENLNFEYATLGQIEIYNSDFSKTNFSTEQSTISKIGWQFVKWPNKLRYFINSNSSLKSETLRILKLNAKEQEDHVNYLNFQSLEMEAITEEYFPFSNKFAGNLSKNWLKKSYELLVKPIFTLFESFFVTQFIEFEKRILFWIAKYTNDFGRSYIRPLFLYLILSYVFFVFVSRDYFFSKFWSLDVLKNPDFYLFLNPTQSFDLIFNNTQFIGRWSLVVHLALRIIQGILIFQMIRSFRRFFAK